MKKKPFKLVAVYRLMSKRLVFFGILIAIPLFLSAPVHAKGFYGKGSNGKFCSATTKAAAKSCDDQLNADYWLAIGKCDNLDDNDEREECFQDAKADKKDARDECRDQTAARQEICEELGEDPYDPVVDSSVFGDDSAMITNSFLPMNPGTTMRYEGGGEVVTVVFTDKTVNILGVECREVRDTVTVDGEITEDTLDWYAQDMDGNVWYFGELSKGYEDGLLATLEGSWTAGVDGAKPGIVMQADPMLFDYYRQEFLLGEAEDMANVIETDGTETVNVTFDGAPMEYTGQVVTEEWTPIEPDVYENKHYAPGIGMIIESDPETGERIIELVEITTN